MLFESREGLAVLDVVAGIALKHGRESVALSTLRRATTLGLKSEDDLYVFLYAVMARADAVSACAPDPHYWVRFLPRFFLTLVLKITFTPLPAADASTICCR